MGYCNICGKEFKSLGLARHQSACRKKNAVIKPPETCSHNFGTVGEREAARCTMCDTVKYGEKFND